MVPATRKTYTHTVNSSSPQDKQGANDLSSRLDKVMEGLLKAEKDIQNRLRAPLDRRSPVQDLSKRIDDHEVRLHNMYKIKLKSVMLVISVLLMNANAMLCRKLHWR